MLEPVAFMQVCLGFPFIYQLPWEPPPKPWFLGVVTVVTHIFLGLKTFRPQIVHGFGVQRYESCYSQWLLTLMVAIVK